MIYFRGYVIKFVISFGFLFVKLHGACPEIKNNNAIIHSVYNHQELITQIDCIRGKSLNKLTISNINYEGDEDDEIYYLPRGLFTNTSIKILKLEDFVLRVLAPPDEPGPSPFHGLENSLQTLVLLHPINENGLSDWQWEELSELHALEKIVITHEALMDDLAGDFSKLAVKTIRWIQITGSCAMEIQDYTLSSFPLLEKISLEGNKLTGLDRRVFPNPANHLVHLDLSNNELYTLDSNLFENMPKLEEIFLENNFIKQFHVFKSEVSSLKKLYIYGNDIYCDSTLEWLVRSNPKDGSTPFYEDGVRPLLCKYPTATMLGKLVRNLTEADLKREAVEPQAIYAFEKYLPIQMCFSEVNVIA